MNICPGEATLIKIVLLLLLKRRIPFSEVYHFSEVPFSEADPFSEGDWRAIMLTGHQSFIISRKLRKTLKYIVLPNSGNKIVIGQGWTNSQFKSIGIDSQMLLYRKYYPVLFRENKYKKAT